MSATDRSTTLPCPLCQEAEASISVNLNCLGDDDCNTFRCHDCDTGFSISHIRSLLRTWPKIITWLEQIPLPESEQ